MNQSERYPGLESLRGLAALLVIWFHVSALNLLVLPTWLTPFVQHFGLGVQMFFILSAFCLCLGYHDRVGTSEGIRSFAIRRFFRIAPLFYVLIAVWVAIEYFKRDNPTTLQEIVLNVTFLFNVPPVGGSIVWAGWTLGVEMMAYALFPLAMILTTTRWQTVIALLVSTLVAFAFQMVLNGADVPPGYAWFGLSAQAPFFVLGILAWHAFNALRQHQRRQAIGNGLLVLTAIYWAVLAVTGLASFQAGGVPIDRYLIGAGFAPLILSQVLAPTRWIVNPATIYLGVRGYSIYLLHPIAVLYTIPLVRETIYGPAQTNAGVFAPFVVSCAVVSAITIFAAHFSYRWIEIPGQEFGKLIAGRKMRRAISPAPAE